ncbi:hypothetical protein TREES_T100015027 [Tupaia chinensis]|uniref:Uncharacterized protein n=1 Tax=Tupaia chinensis TaxID=246437 RepID=L9KIV1_TUPCH|nr:hypothetical protein TREES_T100015027 [Tupaia chinensis]
MGVPDSILFARRLGLVSVIVSFPLILQSTALEQNPPLLPLSSTFRRLTEANYNSNHCHRAEHPQDTLAAAAYTLLNRTSSQCHQGGAQTANSQCTLQPGYCLE